MVKCEQEVKLIESHNVNDTLLFPTYDQVDEELSFKSTGSIS